MTESYRALRERDRTERLQRDVERMLGVPLWNGAIGRRKRPITTGRAWTLITHHADVRQRLHPDGETLIAGVTRRRFEGAGLRYVVARMAIEIRRRQRKEEDR